MCDRSPQQELYRDLTGTTSRDGSLSPHIDAAVVRSGLAILAFVTMSKVDDNAVANEAKELVALCRAGRLFEIENG